MAIETEVMGLTMLIGDAEKEYAAYFRYCAQGEMRLQKCTACSSIRFPPGPSCPYCAHPQSTWTPVQGCGSVHSYTKVVKPIQPGFADLVPYLVLLVELDDQRGLPTPDDAIRLIGNYVNDDGTLASGAQVDDVGIGSRVEMTFNKISDAVALPQWRLDRGAQQSPWTFERHSRH